MERADGKVEAIVAEGEHIGLIEETKEFMKNFHIPAPSPAELQLALAPPPPIHRRLPFPRLISLPRPFRPLIRARPPRRVRRLSLNSSHHRLPLRTDAQSQSEAALQAEPLADYAGNQVRPTPPENLQPANSPAFVTAVPDVVANRSSVTPIGYVEKAGGEKEAIVEYQDQVFLVHEGELFAGKYRVLRLTAIAWRLWKNPLRRLRQPLTAGGRFRSCRSPDSSQFPAESRLAANSPRRAFAGRPSASAIQAALREGASTCVCTHSRKVETTCGSNCVPEQRRNSTSASSKERALL